MGVPAITDKIDDAGLALLASPYIAQVVGSAAGKVEALKPVADGAQKYREGFEEHPEAEIAGLALVSPTVTRRLAGLFAKGASDARAKLGL